MSKALFCETICHLWIDSEKPGRALNEKCVVEKEMWLTTIFELTHLVIQLTEAITHNIWNLIAAMTITSNITNFLSGGDNASKSPKIMLNGQQSSQLPAHLWSLFNSPTIELNWIGQCRVTLLKFFVTRDYETKVKTHIKWNFFSCSQNKHSTLLLMYSNNLKWKFMLPTKMWLTELSTMRQKSLLKFYFLPKYCLMPQKKSVSTGSVLPLLLLPWRKQKKKL